LPLQTPALTVLVTRGWARWYHSNWPIPKAGVAENVASSKVSDLGPTGRNCDHGDDEFPELRALVIFRVPGLEGPAVVGGTRIQRDIATPTCINDTIVHPTTPQRINSPSSILEKTLYVGCYLRFPVHDSTNLPHLLFTPDVSIFNNQSYPDTTTPHTVISLEGFPGSDVCD